MGDKTHSPGTLWRRGGRSQRLGYFVADLVLLSQSGSRSGPRVLGAWKTQRVMEPEVWRNVEGFNDLMIRFSLAQMTEPPGPLRFLDSHTGWQQRGSRIDPQS